MEAKIVREWISSLSKACVSVAKYYSDPRSHWLLVSSEKAKDAFARLVEVVFLSTAVQLLFLSATYKQISTGFGLKVALLVILQAGFLLFYFPGTFLSFKVIRPLTRPSVWHVADYVVMQSQVTILAPSLCFALFYASESYALYYAGTALTLLAAMFFFVRAAMVPSTTAGILRRMAASAVLLACQTVLGAMVALLVLVAPASHRTSLSPFSDPIAGEVFTASLSIDKELNELNTVGFVVKSLSSLNEVIAKLVLRSQKGNVATSTIDRLHSITGDMDIAIRTDRSIVDRVMAELREIKDNSKFRTTKEIARQTEEAVSSYSRFLDSTERYFGSNREIIGILSSISSVDLTAIGTTTMSARKPKTLTAKELEELTHQIEALNQLVAEGIQLADRGNATVKEMTAALNSQRDFERLVSSARTISPLYSIEF